MTTATDTTMLVDVTGPTGPDNHAELSDAISQQFAAAKARVAAGRARMPVTDPSTGEAEASRRTILPASHAHLTPRHAAPAALVDYAGIAQKLMAEEPGLDYTAAFSRALKAKRDGTLAKLLVEANGVSRDSRNAPVPQITRSAIKGPSMELPPMAVFDSIKTTITPQGDGLGWTIDFAPSGTQTNVERLIVPSVEELAQSLIDSGVAPADAYKAASAKIAALFAEALGGGK